MNKLVAASHTIPNCVLRLVTTHRIVPGTLFRSDETLLPANRDDNPEIHTGLWHWERLSKKPRPYYSKTATGLPFQWDLNQKLIEDIRVCSSKMLQPHVLSSDRAEKVTMRIEGEDVTQSYISGHKKSLVSRSAGTNIFTLGGQPGGKSTTPQRSCIISTDCK